MGNKTKRMNRINRKPKKTVKRTKGTATTASQTKKKPISLVQKNPKLTVLIMIATYFLLDYLMMDVTEQLSYGFVVVFALLAVSTLYSFYVFDYHRDIPPTGGTDIPRFVKKKKQYAINGWLGFVLFGALFVLLEPIVVPKFFVVLDTNYFTSQIILMLFIAPIMEEITFRYLMYDRWLKKKWGWFLGFLVSSFLFVLCHPVTDAHALMIYWAPTVLFYLIYHEFGLYGSIIIHMLYNMMAL